MTIRHSPNSGGGSTGKADERIDVAELSERVSDVHKEVKELVIELEKIRHRLDRVEHQIANPE